MIYSEWLKASGLLTRAEAAKRLGISVPTLRRREGSEIDPIMSPLGEHLFRPRDVDALAKSGRARRRFVSNGGRRDGKGRFF